MADDCIYSDKQTTTAELREGQMPELTKKLVTKGVVIAAEASFTRDMAENLLSMFAHLDDGQEITVKLSNKGVWAVTPEGIRLFVGSAEPFEVEGSGSNAVKPSVQ